MKRKSELKRIFKEYENSIAKRCGKCGSEALDVIIDGRKVLQCNWHSCGNRFAINECNLFANLKTKPWKVLRVLDCRMQRMSAENISFVTGLSSKTIRNILSKLKTASAEVLSSSADKSGNLHALQNYLNVCKQKNRVKRKH